MKKMRTWFGIFLGLFLTLALVAAGTGTKVLAARNYNHIFDGANLLTESEERELEELAVAASEEAGADISVITVNDMGGKSAMDFTDDWYDENGYGVGEDNSGILLMICMGTREYWISTCGKTAYEFSESDIDRLENRFLSELSNGDYYGAFESYIDGAKSELMPRTYGLKHLLGSLGGGLLASLVPVNIMKGKNKSIRRASGAASYIKANSMHLTKKYDRFLYRTVNRVHIAREHNNNSGGAGGGHISSSGTFHGGGGGHF